MGKHKIRRPLLTMSSADLSTTVAVTAGGLTVSAGGATITKGGLTVSSGNLGITLGNVVVSSGGLDVPVQTSTALLGWGHCTLTGTSSTKVYSLAAPTAGVPVSLAHLSSTGKTATVTLAAGVSFYTTDSTAATTRKATFSNSAQCLYLMGTSTTKYHVLNNIGTVVLGAT
jgi:hypothetical protein